MADNAVRRISAVLNKMVKTEIKNRETRGFVHLKSRRTKTGTEHAFRLPIGMDFKKITRALGALSANLGTFVELENHFGVVVVRVVHKDFPPKVFPVIDDLNDDKILIGYDRTGAPVFHPLNVHILIAGAAGSGKTDLIRWIAFQLKRQKYQIKICDLKGFSFMPFEGLVEIATNMMQSAKVLGDALKEMERRENLVKKYGSREIIKEFEPLAIIIDEAAQLAPSMHTDKEMKEIAEYCDECIAKIAQKGREPKVFLIYATQRPDRNVLNPQVKANVEASIALRTKTASNSMIILDRPGAEQISPSTPGRCIYSGAAEDILLQVPFVGGDEEWHKFLTELFPDGHHERQQGKAINGPQQSTDRINFAIGAAVTELCSPRERGLPLVKSTSARWSSRGELPRAAKDLEALESWEKGEEQDLEENFEYFAQSSGG